MTIQSTPILDAMYQTIVDINKEMGKPVPTKEQFLRDWEEALKGALADIGEDDGDWDFDQ